VRAASTSVACAAVGGGRGPARGGVGALVERRQAGDGAQGDVDSRAIGRRDLPHHRVEVGEAAVQAGHAPVVEIGRLLMANVGGHAGGALHR
jgi:hypothetical protein